MPELRRDPIIGRWVIISTERSRRPTPGRAEPEDQGSVPCPFCVGNEEKTPPEVLALGAKGRVPNGPGWSVRVVPNKYPALQIEGRVHREGEHLFDKMDGLGAHEVIIETESHKKELEDLPEERIRDVFWAFRERILDLRKDPRFEYVLVFKNKGGEAGASLAHAHSQLIATPMVPIRVKQELRGADDYYETRGRCAFCDVIAAEKGKGLRVVAENAGFVALAPFASRFPFELCILPRAHQADFDRIDEAGLAGLASLMRTLLRKLNNVLDRPPYNFVLHTAPLKSSGLEYYHWHLELMPKLVRTAGFEWGSGFYINPTPPELAARYLREEPEE